MLFTISGIFFFFTDARCLPITNPNLPISSSELHFGYGTEDMKFEDWIDKKSDSRRKKRAALEFKFYRWENTSIPYQFDEVSPVTSQVRNMTIDAFRHIKDKTCVKFVPRTGEFYYINITRANPKACFSFVGRQQQGMLELNLGTFCNHTGTIIHEALHSLGFLHEHSRPDRDQYVIINKTNIRKDALVQFDVYNETALRGVTLYNISYDKQSVMHYQSFTFTTFQKNGILLGNKQEYKTIYSKSDPKEVLGNTRLSPKDILRINTHFGCKTDPNILTTTTTTITRKTTTKTDKQSTSTTTTKTTTTKLTKISTTTSVPTTQGQPTPTKEGRATVRPTILIGTEIFNVTIFGTPDSAITNSLSFFNCIFFLFISIWFTLV